MSGLSGCDTALIYGSIDTSKAQVIFGRYNACMSLGFLIASLMSVKVTLLSKKFGDLKAISILIGIMSVACLVLMLTSSPSLSIGSVTVIALCMALISPIELDVKNKAIQSEDRATHLSVYSMIGGVVASISNVMVGKVADFSI